MNDVNETHPLAFGPRQLDRSPEHLARIRRGLDELTAALEELMARWLDDDDIAAMDPADLMSLAELAAGGPLAGYPFELLEEARHHFLNRPVHGLVGRVLELWGGAGTTLLRDPQDPTRWGLLARPDLRNDCFCTLYDAQMLGVAAALGIELVGDDEPRFVLPGFGPRPGEPDPRCSDNDQGPHRVRRVAAQVQWV